MGVTLVFYEHAYIGSVYLPTKLWQVKFFKKKKKQISVPDTSVELWHCNIWIG